MILFPGTRAYPNYLPIVTVLPQLIGYWTRYHRVAVKYGTAFVSPSCLMNTIGTCVCIIRDKYRFSFSSILDTIQPYCCKIRDSNPFPFCLWSLCTAILLQNTGQLPFFLFVSGHYTMQPYCCKIRDS